MSTISPKLACEMETIIKIEVEETVVQSAPPSFDTLENNPVYHQRKCMLSEYKELFSALLRLPDKEIQAKVLNCINAKYRSVATQTNPVEVIEIAQNTASIEQNVESKVENISEEQIASPTNTHSESVSPTTVNPKKRKRKRKISLPQANKVSRVAVAKNQQLAKLSKPLHQQQKMLEGDGPDQSKKRQCLQPKLFRTDSSDFSDTNSFLNGIVDEFQKAETRSREQLYQAFIRDSILATYVSENGLLPIQESVVQNQISDLNRQIFIWKDWKNSDLNEILTEENEDLLQLSISNRCYPEVAKLLLEKGLNPGSRDCQGNTLLHLAVMHDVDKQLLQELMDRIDLKMLLAFNDEGYTSLHLAIRKDCYLLAECMLNTIDRRLTGKQFYNRLDDILEPDEKLRRLHFQEYYEKECLKMEIDGESSSVVINNHEQKQRLLQTVDKRSGNTSLFFAIENQSEHLVYFLLAHLIDPRTENFSGQDCKSYFSEYCKTLNLSLNIDNAMEKVIKLLS